MGFVKKNKFTKAIYWKNNLYEIRIQDANSDKCFYNVLEDIIKTHNSQLSIITIIFQPRKLRYVYNTSWDKEGFV